MGKYLVYRIVFILGFVLLAWATSPSAFADVPADACKQGGHARSRPLEDITPNICKEGDETPSHAIRHLTGLIPWIQEVILRDKITEAMRKVEGSVVSLLSKTGQVGVAVEVGIEHIEMTGADDRRWTRDKLIGDEVKLIGAGTSLEDVWFAAVSLKQVKDLAVNQDTGRSFFVWFSRRGRNLVTVLVAEQPIRSKVGRLLGDEELTKRQRETLTTSSLDRAIEYLEKNVKKIALVQKIKAIRSAQANDETKIVDIERRLQENIEQKRKAQAIADQFNMIGNALTFAAQKDTIKSLLGKDVPVDKLEKAKTPMDLIQIVQTIIVTKERDKITIMSEKTTMDNRKKDYSTQYLSIVRDRGAAYPYQDVPQLQLPGPP